MTEREFFNELESVMGSIHRVTNAWREIENPRQLEHHKNRLRAELPGYWDEAKRKMEQALKLEMADG
ncbi:MAG: hypothetical protein AAFW60_01885 [Pseudomonadota bacterium]